MPARLALHDRQTVGVEHGVLVRLARGALTGVHPEEFTHCLAFRRRGDAQRGRGIEPRPRRATGDQPVSGEDVFRLLLCLIGVKRRQAPPSVSGIVDGLLDERREHARRSRARHSREEPKAVPVPAAHGDGAPDAVLVDARPPRARACAAPHSRTRTAPQRATWSSKSADENPNARIDRRSRNVASFPR